MYENTPSLLTLALSLYPLLNPTAFWPSGKFRLLSHNFLGLQTKVDNNQSPKDPEISSQSLGKDLQDEQCMQ